MSGKNRWFLTVAALILLAGCSSAPTTTSDSSLYQRLGGKGAITAVVDDLIANIGADTRINAFFMHSDPAQVKRLLVEQICAGTGGPCKYTGRDMKTTHENMAINDGHFNALVEDLVKSLNKFKVPQQEQSELLAILGSMKGAIVSQ